MKFRANRVGFLFEWAFLGAMTATVLILITCATLAQPHDVTWKKKLVEAQEYDAAGRGQEAVTLYRDAADSTPSVQTRAEVLLKLGVLYDRLSSDQTRRQYYLNESAMVFQEAMDLATGELKLQAANNYAAQLLRLGNTQEAVDLMRRVWSEFRNTDLGPEARSHFLYNYARALEQVSQYEAALERYNQSYQAYPDFDPAVRAAARLALHSPSESIGIPELLGLTTGLIKQGNYEAASRYIKQGLMVNHWKYHSDYPRLLTQLVSLFIEARTTPEEYRKEWQQELRLLAEGMGFREADRIQRIDQVYVQTLPMTFENRQARDHFASWATPGEYKTFSAFVKMVGDHYFRTGDPVGALECYSNAWALDTTNMEAGLYLANLLTAEAERIDPEGAYIKDFLFFAFSEKAKAYLGEDWSNILNFHTVLGTLLERQEIWGPDTVVRTAAFQWKHALRAHAQLAKENPETPQTVPAIHSSLGLAYAGYGESKSAWNQYITAAEEYLKLGRNDAARKVFDAAVALDHIPNGREQERLSRLRRTLSVEPKP